MRSLVRTVRRRLLIDHPRPLRRSIAPDALETGEALLLAQDRLLRSDGGRVALAEITLAELLHHDALEREYGPG